MLKVQGDSQVVTYTELLKAVDEGKVKEVLLENERILARLKEEKGGREQAMVSAMTR